MAPSQDMARWQAEWCRELDQVSRHLCKTAPGSARSQLQALRSEVCSSTPECDLRDIQSHIEGVLESKPYFRGAYARWEREALDDFVGFLDEQISHLQAWKEAHGVTSGSEDEDEVRDSQPADAPDRE